MTTLLEHVQASRTNEAGPAIAAELKQTLAQFAVKYRGTVVVANYNGPFVTILSSAGVERTEHYTRSLWQPLPEHILAELADLRDYSVHSIGDAIDGVRLAWKQTRP